MFHETHFQLLFLPFLLLPLICTSTDTITSNITIKDGDVVVSSGKRFALGFFSPGSSVKRYVGIWYNNVSEQTVVWVANRDSPLNDTSGALSIDKTGNLVIHGTRASNTPVWSTSVSVADPTNVGCSAQLLDTGNLVLYRDDTKRVVAWQSFDHPTHTMLPYMKLGVNRRTGLNRFLTSWKSSDDPGTGGYKYKIDMSGLPQLFLFKGSDRFWRAGPWNGVRWTGVPEMTPNFIFNVTYVDSPEELFVMYGIRNASILSRMTVNESGVVERLTWHERERRWIEFWSAPKDRCDYYNQCGPFGDCNTQDAGEFECTCLPGFEPKLPRDWYLRDASGGCVRKRGGHACGNGEGFVRMARAKLPDTSAVTHVDHNVAGLKECEEVCLKNCSCVAYTSADVRGSGAGCMTWHGELVDTREFTGGGQDLYVRVDAVELAQYSKSKGNNRKKIVAILVVSIAVALLLIILVSYWVMFKRKENKERANLLFSSTSLADSSMGKEFDESGARADLPFFDLSTIVAATHNFSPDNKLGEGGFGSVYKGRLSDGQEIAIKRLAKHSGQGIEEFKNEVNLIAKLQHRNLVRLVGYCTQKEEKMLIYEFLPNKGLDTVIFDKDKASLVDWKKRFEIILGIARGMLYLHQDSRLRIIHRDLKASNVLLDAAMNPKISDFGMARIFGADQIEANTNRVVGTYGYMSPEYAMEGQFSIKSDVFSFGVLLLEIITGRKNNSYYQENSVNLIGHVWDLWTGGEALDIVDSSLGVSYEGDEVERCIHIGLLCVQEAAADRPTMSTVLFMLSSGTHLPPPKQPAFILKRPNKGTDTTTSTSVGGHSVNDVTISMIEAR